MAFVAIPDKVILPLIAHSTTTDSNTHPPTVNNYSCQLSQSLCTVPSTYTEDIVRSPQAVWYCSSSVITAIPVCLSGVGRSVEIWGSSISCNCQQLTTSHSQFGLGSARLCVCQCLLFSVLRLLCLERDSTVVIEL